MENSETGLQVITDSIEHALTGIPAPIRKNFFKAFAQLCTAAVDIPVAYLEGKSAEIRAATNARVKIINKEGQSISEKIDVPQEYIEKASAKYAAKVIKEQINLDEILLKAAEDLSGKEGQEGPQQPVEKEIGDDWLNEFESQARLKSSEEMKVIFSKILSGEISSPGSFSIRTLKLIAQLDNQAANLFQLLCSQSVSMIIGGYLFDARMVSFTGSPASNSLSPFGLSFDNLNILQEYGLIISDYNSYTQYSPCIANENNVVSAVLGFNKKNYGLIPTDREKYDRVLQLNGVALTKAGKELLSIIPVENKDNYEKALIEYFGGKYLQMSEVKM